MKASEIRDMTPAECEQKVSELKQELFNLRFQHGIGQLENPSKMRDTKRDIARLKTIMQQMAAAEDAN